MAAIPSGHYPIPSSLLRVIIGNLGPVAPSLTP